VRLVLLLEHFPICVEQPVHVKLGLQILQAVERERFAGHDEKAPCANRKSNAGPSLTKAIRIFMSRRNFFTADKPERHFPISEKQTDHLIKKGVGRRAFSEAIDTINLWRSVVLTFAKNKPCALSIAWDPPIS
jgi:hypothetical protein